MLNHTVNLWSGIEHQSLEKCNVREYIRQKEITATIVGCHEQNIYKAGYTIVTDASWRTIEASINFELGIKSSTYNIKLNDNGEWTSSGVPDEVLNGCTDVDISLSPFTNTLPIRRLKLAPAQTQQVKVIYFDLLAQTFKPALQKYSCLSNQQYKYENVPNNFEAIITVDEQGFVTDYPGLFVRTAVELLNA